MTVYEWLDANRNRLQGKADNWVTRRVAVLEVPGRTVTVGCEPVERDVEAPAPQDGKEPVLNACLVELGIEHGKPVLSRVIEDAPAR
ncbi:MAG: hypothetical protein M3Z97_04375 [Candidatus Dormibacteraeota bacterium]|jgi:hypothetical protein|nr:hypothetical protein [Candidatus Dormibacteraeota bacterium]